MFEPKCSGFILEKNSFLRYTSYLLKFFFSTYADNEFLCCSILRTNHNPGNLNNDIVGRESDSFHIHRIQSQGVYHHQLVLHLRLRFKYQVYFIDQFIE